MHIENFRLAVFRSVARHLNFSRAAEELLLTQPAVTKQIKALEEEFGLPLFDRSGGHIRLTKYGSALLPYAERLKELGDEAYSAVTMLADQHAGSLSVGASNTIGQYLLSSVIAGFVREQPQVRITARSGNADETIELLLGKHIQLALVEGRVTRNDVHHETFMRDRMVLVVPVDHPWAEKTIEVDELETCPLLMREFGSGSRRTIEHALNEAGLSSKSLTIPIELDSTEGLVSAVEAGLGVTFVSQWAVRHQLALGSLKLARVRGLKLSLLFSLVYPAGPEPGGNAGLFRRFLLEWAQTFSR
jgi:DNA-binding transcriptional LysR family regulator